MGVQDDYNEAYDAGVRDATDRERHRAALLCLMMAKVHEGSAQRIRDEGTVTSRSLWPWRKYKFILPMWQKAAKALDAAGYSLRAVAQAISCGYDPEKAEEREREAEKLSLMQAELTEDQKAELLRRAGGL